MAGISQDEATFVEGVSDATGIDPRVLVAWVQQEGADAPGGTGGSNYLNLRPATGDVGVSKVTSGGFDNFTSTQDAIASTVARLKQPFAANIISAAATKPTPAQEIAAIASTGWDAGHYGGAGGPNLLATYDSIFVSGDNPYQPPSAAAQILPSVGTGSAADALSGETLSGAGNAGVAGLESGDVKPAIDAVKNKIDSTDSLIKFLTSWRFAEVVGGFLLLLVGLVLLGKQFGLAVPAPGPLASPPTQSDVATTFQFQPGERAYAAAQPTSRARKTRTVSHTLPVDKPAPARVSSPSTGDIPY